MRYFYISQLIMSFYVTIFYFSIYLFIEKNYSYRYIFAAFVITTLSMCVPNTVYSIGHVIFMYILGMPGLSGFLIYIGRIPRKIKQKKYFTLIPLILWIYIFSVLFNFPNR